MMARTPATALSAALLLVVLEGTAHAQQEPAEPPGYLLVGDFGEICTMCEAMLVCQAGAEPPAGGTLPDGGSFTLYHVHTRSFWSQVYTIWEVFASQFSDRPRAAPPRSLPPRVRLRLEPARTHMIAAEQTWIRRSTNPATSAFSSWYRARTTTR